MGQIKEFIPGKIQASDGTNIFYIPYQPAITSYSKNCEFIAILFNPTYPKDFSGNYIDVIREVWLRSWYPTKDEFDCGAINHKGLPSERCKYIEVRVVDDCGVHHDMTFKEFKKFIYE